MQIKLKPNVRPVQIPCDPVYFEKHMKKPMKVVKEYSSMVRAVDGAGEEWSFFNGQFVIVTGL